MALQKKEYDKLVDRLEGATTEVNRARMGEQDSESQVVELNLKIEDLKNKISMMEINMSRLNKKIDILEEDNSHLGNLHIITCI